MEKKLIAKNCFESELRFPIFCHYDDQFEPQPAFIFLDIETGEVNANYDRTIGSGLPICVWNNIELRFYINPYTHAEKIVDLINENIGNFQIILDGSEIVWNGSEYIGTFDNDAQKMIEKFNNENSLYDFVDTVMFENISDFSDELWFSKDTQTLTELATYIYELGNDAGYWSDELNSIECIEYEILDYWLHRLYSGDHIPKKEAQLLIKDDRVDISEKWMTEINKFAA